MSSIVPADHHRPPGTGPVRRVALVGLPGSGKSAVGAALAERLGWRFADTDALVELREGRSIAAIFAADGEAGFRRRELEALRDALTGNGPLVLACGGGLLTEVGARDLLARSTCIVWLDGDDATLLRRLGEAADRPLLRGDPASRLAELRTARTRQYAAAQVRVDVAGADIEEVCERVADAIAGARLGAEPGPSVVRVALGERSYDVVVGEGIALQVADHLPEGCGRVAVVADRAVAALARQLVSALRAAGRQASLMPLTGGEAVKTWAAAGRLVNRFAGLGLDRGDCAIAVGGGSVGDLCGFAAATYQRGIAVLQVPTTLLAMVDSAIGGKTGVNLPTGKNLAGAFWQPRAVVCDVATLGTLDDRSYRAAFAEIVKYAMAADASLPVLLDDHLEALLARDAAALVPLVQRCCAIKADVVGDDEREAGRRAILNYGHTVGHALEATLGFGDALLHGEAVACGMGVAARLSEAVLGCPEGDVRWQDETLRRCGLGGAPAVDVDEVVLRTQADKKARAGAVRWVLLERLGVASYGHVLPQEAVRAAVASVLAG
jgi:3-dehydroquinate synthase